MRRVLFMLAASVSLLARATTMLIEAESFAEKGGWVTDTQFVDCMGSPYLLAHGLGIPVADASTSVTLPAGTWRLWVRTRDWTPDYTAGEKPGRFQILINGTAVKTIFGTTPADWGWVNGGTFTAEGTTLTLALHDLTGFEGRCDALCLTDDLSAAAPPDSGAALAAWRASIRGEAFEPENTAAYDFVIVGGGLAGTCAAIAAAEQGLTVALVQDRPMLGGNASDEIRVKTQRTPRHRIVKSVMSNSRNAAGGDARAAQDDTNRLAIIRTFPNIDCLTGYRAYGVVTNGAGFLTAVDARRVSDGARYRLTAPYFADCTGDGWIAYWAGAAWRMGREAQSEFAESLAPIAADSCTMGNSMIWTSQTNAEDHAFPEVPWALTVSGANAATNGDWHWEAGLGPAENTLWEAESLRDRLFRAVYGSFYTAKQKLAAASTLTLHWVPFNAGKRETRRILGDYVIKQSDIVNTVWFDDSVAMADWSIDLHYYRASSNFLADTVQTAVPPWYLPYRSLCCRDVRNLFLAGRDISQTHVALGSSRVMDTCGQMGVAVGYAASLCKKYACLPRAIYQSAAKTVELQALIGGAWPAEPLAASDTAALASIAVDNPAAEFSGTWVLSTHSTNRYGANYHHNAQIAAADVWARFRPDLPAEGSYRLDQIWNGGNSSSRASRVPIEIQTADGTVTQTVDMTSDAASGKWNTLGTWRFAAGTNGFARILTEGTSGFIIADAFRWERLPSVILDNADASGVQISGAWTLSAYNPHRYGANYLFACKTSAGNADTWVRYTPDLPTNGTYEVRLLWNASAGRCTNAFVEVTCASGVCTSVVDMTAEVVTNSANPIGWSILGRWPFTAGTNGFIRILTENVPNGAVIIADAVWLALVPANSTDTDRDGNGLPDAWEREHFLVTSGIDPDADPDGDGLCNYGEYRAGTDPNDASSRFCIRDFFAADEPEAKTPAITLSWASTTNRHYTVLKADTLGNAFAPYVTDIPATPPQNTFAIPLGDPAAFYRVRVQE